MSLLKFQRKEYSEQRSPTLNTVLMVEEALKNADGMITLAELKRKLPKQVMHSTLRNVLNYLAYSGKIYYNEKGILWIEYDSKKLEMARKNSLKIR